MSKIKTKADLLKLIDKYRGCDGARDYVNTFTARVPAKRIWEMCGNEEWLFWLGTRFNPPVAVAYMASVLKRLKKESITGNSYQQECSSLQEAVEEYDVAVAFLKQNELEGYYSALTWSFHDALFVANNLRAEKLLRLTQLRAMW